MAEVCITGFLRDTPIVALVFTLDLLPVDGMGVKIATLVAVRLWEAKLWSKTSFGHTQLDLHHFMPEGSSSPSPRRTPKQKLQSRHSLQGGLGCANPWALYIYTD